MDEQKKYELTQDAVDRLKERLGWLEGEGRQQIIEQIATARAHGDLSENAEYHAAKDQQGLQESEVRKIRYMLENVVIIETTDDGVVAPGKFVTIRHEGESEAETYFLGRREEKTGDFDVLTPESPIGSAIVGHSVGETLVAKGPHGNDMKVEIVEIKTP